MLMPGLTDMHVHLMWNLGPMELIGARPDYVAATALKEAEATLMRGYTSSVTAGGIQGVARAIDEGLYPGPRVQGSHGGLTMTAGHADYRNRNVALDKFGGPPETELEKLGIARNADGVPDVLAATRDSFRQGANFIKMFVGGAVSGSMTRSTSPSTRRRRSLPPPARPSGGTPTCPCTPTRISRPGPRWSRVRCPSNMAT
ncbi:MAG: amidohydrolase family protein [Rhodobacteraceae bacterium]|nr:amidohydrolase family protein [Paracoccaceae bacterium]